MTYHLSPGIPKVAHEVPTARLSTREERYEDRLKKLPQAVGTAWCGLAHGHAKDHMLGRLDDTSRTLGVATIAGLGSLGSSYRGASLPLWLGGASWLGAMAVTPHVINSAVYLKTGVPLGKKYVSSNGEIKPLFQDPNYLPLQVLPHEQRVKLAERLGIPGNHPDRPALLQAKLKQIIVQAHTWWMLMAGMATPVLASVFCDLVEDPLKNWVTQLRPWYINRYQIQPALLTASGSRLGGALKNMIDAVVGEGSELTMNARWWKQLPKNLVEALHLHQLSQDVLLHPSSGVRQEAIVKHMVQQLKRLEVQDALQTLVVKERQNLNAFLEPAEKLLRQEVVKAKVAKATRIRLAHKVQLARETAEATLNHFEALLKRPWAKMSQAKAEAVLKQEMEKRVLPYVEQLNRLGYVSRAAHLTGGKAWFEKVINALSLGRFGPAFKQMGDSPMSLLSNAVESLGLRRRWLRRFPGAIGGGMIVSTVLFMAYCLGKDFKPAASKGDMP